MAQRLFGLETEYAFSAIGQEGARVSQQWAVGRLMNLASKRLPHLPGESSPGLFLQNGSRFYVDSGQHPEISTPEVADPWNACRYALAGDRILADLAVELAAEERAVDRAVVTRCNVCYGDAPTTWGCHESYQHRGDPAEVGQQLIPHLVSRVIYCGAGGFNNRHPGLEFMLSPRLAHLGQVFSANSTHDRGIIHLKDEPLSGKGYHRLHIICGESVSSQIALWLKTAITALIVAMIEAGLNPCGAIRLRDPLDAMRRFAVDPDFTARAEASDGLQWSAIEIQRHLVARIEFHLDHPIMPSWAKTACSRLRWILNRLEQGPAGVARTLDWAIKLSLYRQVARTRGVRLESFGPWNYVLGKLQQTLRERSGGGLPPPISRELLGRNSPIGDEMRRLTPFLRNQRLNWEQLEAVLALRPVLFALDTQFGQLGEQGIFAALDRSGALDHAVPGVGDIESAVANPPAVGRAKLRGECVRRFHGQNGYYRCEWTGLWDHREKRYLDLSDPFATEEHWRPLSGHEARQAGIGSRQGVTLILDDRRGSCVIIRQPASRTSLAPYQRLTALVRYLYLEGRYEEAHAMLEEHRSLESDCPTDCRLDLLRLRARLQSRRGFLDSVPILDEVSRQIPLSLDLITDYALAYRFRGLTPAPEIAQWIDKGLDFLQENPNRDAATVTAFREQHGYHLMTSGRLREAHSVLEDFLAREREFRRHDMRALCRGKAMLGETCRRLHQYGEAWQLLKEARAQQAALHYRNDLANATLLYLAKLAADPGLAGSLLAEAKAIQTELQDRMALARTLLLEARLLPGADHAATIKQRVLELIEQVPLLGRCPLTARVIARWDTWASTRRVPDDARDVFWAI